MRTVVRRSVRVKSGHPLSPDRVAEVPASSHPMSFGLARHRARPQRKIGIKTLYVGRDLHRELAQ
jgi:glutamine phosphoribosylpyrophosphate amidotransferase